MKQLKKAIVLAVLAVVMTLMVQKDADAAILNTPSALVMGKNYNVKLQGTDYYEYTLNLTKSGKVTFALNATVEDDAKMDIKDVSDKIVTYTIGAGLNNYSTELLAGTYTVIFRGGWSWSDLEASFVPSFVASGESVNENYMNQNNQLGTATTYTIGKTVKAHFAANDDTDIYKVRISKNGYLTMRFTNSIKSMNMAITCPDAGVTYNEYDIPLGTNSFKYAVPKGTYYISFTKDGYDGNYSFSSKLSNLTTTKVKSVKNQKGKVVKVTWAKKATVNGYEVQIATKKNFKKGRKTQTLSVSYYTHPTNYTFTGLKKGKTYYARVRTYVLVNGNPVYSNWSNVKKVTVKR